MAYLTKDDVIGLFDILHLGVLTNIKGRYTNPTLAISIEIDANTTKIISTHYVVKCFENKNEIGYFFLVFTQLIQKLNKLMMRLSIRLKLTEL